MTRGKMIRLLLAIPLLAAGLALGGARPASAATVCSTSGGAPLTGVIKDSLVVKTGGAASPSRGRRISRKFFQSEVRGDVTIIGASTAALNVSTVRGSATVSDNVHAVVDANTIGANLTCAGNGPTSIFGSNTAGGANNCPAE